MTVVWKCSCGARFGTEARKAFQHRREDDIITHHVTPVLIARDEDFADFSLLAMPTRKEIECRTATNR